MILNLATYLLMQRERYFNGKNMLALYTTKFVDMNKTSPKSVEAI
jgi:hypothetical protein